MTIFWPILSIGLALALGLALLRMRAHRRAWRQLRGLVEMATAGDRPPRLEVSHPPTARALAVSLSRMLRLNENRFEAEMRHRRELEAVLRSMIEGVVVIDLNQNIRSLNLAAGRLLGVDPISVIGRNVLEIVRDLPLQDFIGEALTTNVPIQDEIPLRLVDREGDEGQARTAGRAAATALTTRLLEVQASTLYASSGERIGAIIVLHDVTRLRRLESVRRDFVANVSHEIKTPVAAIKASVETILDAEEVSRDEHDRFLAIIGRQADRLQAIIEDLLSLARIEQEAKDARIELARGPLIRSIRESVETCQAKARDKRVTIRIDCPESLHATFNSRLIEQALVNLLDNALKFSPPGKPISIHVLADVPNEIRIEVRDQGPGIAPEHHERLFERFYRTDRARSRQMGGTGLGLAIVKHIMDAHGGHVSLRSRPGAGSSFFLHLPQSPGIDHPGKPITLEPVSDDHPHAMPASDDEPDAQPMIERKSAG
ncbi:MAG: PAS domain-containing protein [Phycisphaeraceae bacterium]|nr:PAS domain-containing protein [Phycisphaeraceae bacterium]